MYPHGMSFEATKAAAESGDPKAAFHLGWRYYIGSEVLTDKAEACKWYNKAASLGLREAAEIRGILEVEAQRGLDLEVLRERMPSPGRRLTVWLLLLCAILTIGSIGMMLHVFGGRPDTGKAGASEDGKASEAGAALHAPNQSPGNSEKQTPHTQEEARSDDSTRASVTGHSSNSSTAEYGNADSAVAMVPRPQPRPPADPERSVDPRVDFNDWAERARRWLEDVNDPYGPGRPRKDAHQGKN